MEKQGEFPGPIGPECSNKSCATVVAVLAIIVAVILSAAPLLK